MRNRVGPVVTGSDFFGRDAEVEEIMRLLRDGEHLSLTAQRRIGKSSVLSAVQTRMEGVDCLYVDLQACRDAADVVAEIATAAWPLTSVRSRLRATFGNVLESVESIGGEDLKLQLRSGLIGDWRVKGDRVLGELARNDRPVILMLDELSVLVANLLRQESGARRAEELLSWLRRGALTQGGGLRMVLTGSIGLSPLAHRAGASGALNHLREVRLEPWSAATAREALGQLALTRARRFDDAARDEVVRRLGICIPYHIQVFFQLLDEDADRRKNPLITAVDVGRVYDERLMSNRGNVDLMHMEERLGLMVPESDRPLVLNLLTEAAVTGHLRGDTALRLAQAHAPNDPAPERLLETVLPMLEYDGYLRREADGKRRFASRLLQDWWRRRYGEFYTSPATQGAT